MINPQPKFYPDISDILARKAEGRRALARRSFAEKIAWCEAAREQLLPFKRARQARRAAQAAQASQAKLGD
jgi:hypothetical protein